MPVASVVGEPGGVEAQHGSDVPGTQPCYQPVESRAAPPSRWRSGRDRHRSLRLRENPGGERPRRARTGAAGSRGCSGPGPGWTTGHRRPLCASALQYRGRKEISARHRHAPRPLRRPPPTCGELSPVRGSSGLSNIADASFEALSRDALMTPMRSRISISSCDGSGGGLVKRRAA